MRPVVRTPATRAVLTCVLLVLPGCHADLADDATPSPLRRVITVEAAPAESECPSAVVHDVAPPAALFALEEGSCDAEELYCFRLRDDLREVAARREPLHALTLSAQAFARFDATSDPAALDDARALADLSVTGGVSYARFVELAPLASDIPEPSAAAEAAIDRAYAVAWAVHGPAAHRARARAALGWVAVSPEDDAPIAPINVSGPPVPTSRLTLSVRGEAGIRSVSTRAAVFSTTPALEPEAPATLTGSLPTPASLELPTEGPIVLLLHGHSSTLEEGGPLAAALVDGWTARHAGAPLAVVAMDLPSNGYAERFGPQEILDDPAGFRSVIGFVDAFVAAVVAWLEERSPRASSRLVVAGGSLGGNLSLRVAERAAERGWPRAAVVWSPASIDYSWARARPPLAAGAGEYVDFVKFEAVRQSLDQSRAEEDARSRGAYFSGGLSSVRTQSSYWYDDAWSACSGDAVLEGLWLRAEAYDERYRRWHYRVAYEQLVASHIDVAEDGLRPFEHIDIPLFLATGEGDDRMPVSTFSFVERLAPHLDAPGHTVYFLATGHTIHSERPHGLAERVLDFLGELEADAAR